jgi:hypothetical protein
MKAKGKRKPCICRKCGRKFSAKPFIADSYPSVCSREECKTHYGSAKS